MILTALTVTFSGSLFSDAYPDSTLLGAVFLALREPRLLLTGVPYATCLLGILGAHEMGHYLACRRYRIPATLPYFIPGIPPFGTFGAVIRIRGRIPHRRALFDIAAAGPIAGFVVALPVLAWGLHRAVPVPEDFGEGGWGLGTPLLALLLRVAGLGPEATPLVGPLYVAGWFGMLVTSMNLFPVGQLDGGHAVYALSRRAHRAMARLCIMVMIALVAVQTVFYRIPSFWTLWCVVLLVLRDRHPPLLDEETPLNAGRRWLLGLLTVVFILAFIPIPIRFL